MPSFAALIVEREPLRAADLPGRLLAWAQDAGGFAAIGLAIWSIAYLLKAAPPALHADRPRWLRRAFQASLVAALICYAAAGLALVFGSFPPEMWLTGGGVSALVAVGLPFAADLGRLRPRRVIALARLSIREGLSRWVGWLFVPLVLVVLFGDWFLPGSGEARLQAYILLLYHAMTPLLLVTAVLLAAFSIPNDLRLQTVATVVTKPVERFEIVLGRFFGYVALMTGVLLAMSAVGLGLILMQPTGGEPPRARLPLYGLLEVRGKQPGFQGAPSLKTWDYRRFIAGASSHRAIWKFDDLPTRLDERAFVPCEFGFDLERTRKRERENEGVLVSFAFKTRNYDRAQERPYLEACDRARAAGNADAVALALGQVAEQYGIYEVANKEIANFKTYAIDVPAGLFRNAARGEDDPRRPAPPLTVEVKCENPSQLLGVARHDLYFVDAEGSFAVNFFKGALGLWFNLCAVIGVAVALSTYLSGVIALAATLLIYLGGSWADFVGKVATGQIEGGGPLESFRAMVTNQPPGIIDDTATVQMIRFFDEGYRRYLRMFAQILPDVDLFRLSDQVAAGFDVPAADIGLRLIVLVGYLLPWSVLAYYLMKAREIAA